MLLFPINVLSNTIYKNIVTVDMYKIFMCIPQTKDATLKLKKEFWNRFIELKQINKDLKNKIRKLKSIYPYAKDNDKKNLENEIISKKRMFSHKIKMFEKDNNRRQKEEQNKIIKYIKDIIKNIANEKHYDLVIDINSTIYSNKQVDITNEVLKRAK